MVLMRDVERYSSSAKEGKKIFSVHEIFCEEA